MSAQTPEGRVKAKVKMLLAQHNVWFFMPVQTGFGESALDFICAHPLTRMMFAIETEAPGAHLTPRQGVLSKRRKID